MTLIAAFRCQEGLIICADSLESVEGGYRVTVDKIRPQRAGEYQAVIGGAGNVAHLIDAFTDSLLLEVEAWPSGLSERDIKAKLRALLTDFNKTEVAHYQAKRDDKHLEFLVCLLDKQAGTFTLWEIRGSAVKRALDYALLGWRDYIYYHEVQRLLRKNVSGVDAVMFAIHLFALAKATSTYIGGDTQIIFVDKGGVHWQLPIFARETGERIKAFDKALANVVLTLPNLVISNERLEKIIDEFKAEVMELRAHYDERWKEMVGRLSSGLMPGD